MRADPPLTLAEITAERRYRYEERLGILADGHPVTPDMERIARQEADSWFDTACEENLEPDPLWAGTSKQNLAPAASPRLSRGVNPPEVISTLRGQPLTQPSLL